MNSAKNNAVASNYSFILAGIIFSAVLLTSLIIFNFVSLPASGLALALCVMIALAAALMCAVLICVRYSKAHKLRNPADISKKDMHFYFKRMAFVAFMMILMNLAASLVGTIANGLIGGLLTRSIENAFIRGFILKLPAFALYLSFVYKMLVRYGFTDCGKKIHNPKFYLLSAIISLTVMLPVTIHGSIFLTDTFEAAVINALTVLSPNVNRYIMDDHYILLNENFNIFLVALSVLATLAITAAFALFAYRKGKKIFIKNHIRILDEYDTDENV